MKNALTSAFLCATMALSGCCSTQKKYEALVATTLADVDSPGRNLAEAINYQLHAQEVSASTQAR